MLQATGVAGAVTLGGCAMNLSAAILGNAAGGAALGAVYWLVYGRGRKEGE